MEPSYIVEELELEYKNDLNLAENMLNIVNEFKKACNLNSIKVLIHGPPASGKTTLAKDLCNKYGLHYVSPETVVEETLENLRDRIATEKAAISAREERDRMAEARDAAGEDADLEVVEEEEEDENPDLEELEEQLRDLETSIETAQNNQLPDELMIKLIRDMLGSNICQNQGYILDGYPNTMQQANELFGVGESADEEIGEEDAEGNLAGNKIMPRYVISLQATDEFICERIMQLPEEQVQNTNFEEERLLQRLEEYHLNNNEDNTLLNFFNEIEIHPIMLDVMVDQMEPVLITIFQQLGHVVGFPKSPEEIGFALQCQAEVEKLKAEQNALESNIHEIKLMEEHRVKMEEWTRQLEQYQLEEEKLIVVQSEPLRNYLMNHVFPTLTEGLLEVAYLKPDDPIDFLAEYLFKTNPEGKMFDPTYSRDGEKLMADRKSSRPNNQ